MDLKTTQQSMTNTDKHVKKECFGYWSECPYEEPDFYYTKSERMVMNRNLCFCQPECFKKWKDSGGQLHGNFPWCQ